MKTTERKGVLAAGTPAPQQLVQDAGLFQDSEVGDVLADDGDVLALRLLAFVVVAVAQRAQQGVVLVCGEVIPEERSGSEVNLHSRT